MVVATPQSSTHVYSVHTHTDIFSTKTLYKLHPSKWVWLGVWLTYQLSLMAVDLLLLVHSSVHLPHQ